MKIDTSWLSWLHYLGPCRKLLVIVGKARRKAKETLASLSRTIAEVFKRWYDWIKTNRQKDENICFLMLADLFPASSQGVKTAKSPSQLRSIFMPVLLSLVDRQAVRRRFRVWPIIASQFPPETRSQTSPSLPIASYEGY